MRAYVIRLRNHVIRIPLTQLQELFSDILNYLWTKQSIHSLISFQNVLSIARELTYILSGARNS